MAEKNLVEKKLTLLFNIIVKRLRPLFVGGAIGLQIPVD